MTLDGSVGRDRLPTACSDRAGKGEQNAGIVFRIVRRNSAWRECQIACRSIKTEGFLTFGWRPCRFDAAVGMTAAGKSLRTLPLWKSRCRTGGG